MIKTEYVTYRGKQIPPQQLKPHSNRIKFVVECDECHKEFETTMAKLTRNGHQLCQRCAIREKELKLLPIGHKQDRLTIIDIDYENLVYTCKCECGNIIKVAHKSFRNHQVKSCGCLQKDKASEFIQTLTEKQVCNQHPNWKGGITPENEKIRKSKKYKLFRQKVYERDNYTCQLCGKGSNHLVVHHLNAFNKNREQVYDENKGITLCEKCHKQYHHIFGMDTTKEQFEKYKQEIQKIGEKTYEKHNN